MSPVVDPPQKFGERQREPCHTSRKALTAKRYPAPPPPLELTPPRWGTVTLAQKAQEILGAKGAKENFYKAPKLIYTVILWYRFVVRFPPPPRGGEPSLCDPRGGTSPTKGGTFQGGA